MTDPAPSPRGIPLEAADSFPERLGDFRLLERLGGGGMGVVYLARQQSLGRLVALKLIRPEILYFPGARDRFLREVEATARLQHPGIVPIHTFGEQDGVPFFAMERVEGCTLAETIRALAGRDAEKLTGADLARVVASCTAASLGDAGSAGNSEAQGAGPLFEGSYVEATLRIARQLADALTHAHARGVLHRDVKPSNVMLTPGGRVLLLDFGIASTEGVSPLTRTGTVLGSLPYLAPEQVDGQSPPAARSDLYSLGVTLYEMLTLRSPWRSPTAEGLRAEIAAGRPPSIHDQNVAVAWDVETVCLTAMERDPERRYATLAAFAEDLENLLRLRPIRARRASAALRARRWAQRHPTRTVALALGALALIGGAISYGVIQQRHIANLKVEQARTARENERAVVNFHRVRDAISRMLDRIEDPRLDDVPEIGPLRRDVYTETLAIYEGFRGEEASDAQLRADSGRNRLRLGEMLSTLGRASEAERAYLEAIELFDALLREHPDDREVAFERGRALGSLALFEIDAGRPDDAVGHATAMRDVFQALEAKDPASNQFANQVIQACFILSFAHSRRADADAALEAASEIVERSSRLLPDAAEPEEIESALGALASLVKAGALLAYLQRPKEAEELFARAEPLLAAIPSRPELSLGLESTRAELAIGRADAAAKLGRVDDEEKYRTEAVDRVRALFARHPERMYVRSSFATVLSNLGQMRIERGDPGAARPLLEEAAKLLEEAAFLEPEVAEHGAKLSATLTNLAVAELDLGDPDRALPRLVRAAQESAAFRARNPDDPRGRIYEISALSFLAEAQVALELWDEAARTADELELVAPGDEATLQRAARIRAICASNRQGED